MKLHVLTNSKVLISNITTGFFIVWSNSTQIMYFWSKSQSVFVLHETLHFDKLEGADFKYGNSFHE